MRYRWETGFWAFLLMRISGLALIVYLILHINVLKTLLDGPSAFDALMATVQSPFFKLGEIALLGAVLFHCLNGLRVIWVDLGPGVKTQKGWFWAVICASVILFLIGAIPILKTL
jgi:succinate dehydrogenase / fumarate reductase cytochrome b subunit